MSVGAQRRALLGSRVFLTLCAAWFTAMYIVPVLEDWGVPTFLGLALGLGIQLALWGPIVNVSAARWLGDYELTRQIRPLRTAIGMGVSLATSAYLVRRAGTDIPVLGTDIGIAAQGIGAGIYGYVLARSTTEGALFRRQQTNDPELAAELAERCRTALADTSLDDEQRAVASINLADALIVLSARAGREHLLTESISILEVVIDSSRPKLAFEAADSLVGAMRLKAARGDDVGYDEALAVLYEKAQQASGEVPHAVGAALGARALRWEELGSETDDEEEAERLESAALADLEAALAAVPEAVDSHAVHRALLANRSAAHPLTGNIDDAVRECRKAVRRLKRGNPGARARAKLLYAEVLEMRAALDPTWPFGAFLLKLIPPPLRNGHLASVARRAPNDLIKAMWLCNQVAIGTMYADEARMRLPRLREKLSRESRSGPTRRRDRRTAWMYANVFKEQAAMSESAAADVASEWIDWALDRDDPAHAAEAAWCWVTAVTADIRRRVLHGKEQRIGTLQQAVADAALMLLDADRARDATLALDMGRAIVLTERIGRDRGDLGARLAAAGHAGLAQDWRAASAQITEADRASLNGANGARPNVAASAEYVALVEHERLLREIAALPGFEDVEAPLDYDDLRAATADGPLVYLAASYAGGFAIVVTAHDEPRVVELEAMDRDAVTSLTSYVASAARSPGTMQTLLSFVWRSIMEPVVDALEPGSLVTLIAGGALAELPLHVAGSHRDASGTWRDMTGGMAFRYAPNARVLLRAQRTRAELDGTGLRALTVGVTDAPGRRRLPYAGTESLGVATRFGDAALRPRPATEAVVQGALEDTTVWHFACHGVHDPRSPLDSSLQLADRPLTLRSIFTRRRSHARLAVMSACHSATLDADLPDEVVGFPSAMLETGVAGVIACQAEVDDYAAMLLVLAFFIRFREPKCGARALSDAQAWLRMATNAEIGVAFPNLHVVPEDELDNVDRWNRDRPFNEPSTWPLFSYTGA